MCHLAYAVAIKTDCRLRMDESTACTFRWREREAIRVTIFIIVEEMKNTNNVHLNKTKQNTGNYKNTNATIATVCFCSNTSSCFQFINSI